MTLRVRTIPSKMFVPVCASPFLFVRGYERNWQLRNVAAMHIATVCAFSQLLVANQMRQVPRYGIVELTLSTPVIPKGMNTSQLSGLA